MAANPLLLQAILPALGDFSNSTHGGKTEKEWGAKAAQLQKIRAANHFLLASGAVAG
jgi:hypothetical protein